MRGRRVISLLLSLVMALSLCSGVWAENEVTASDEGVTVNYAERTVRFYPVMNGGYLKYDPDDPDELKVDGRNIEYTVGDDTRTIPAFFIRATGDFSEAHLFLAIDKNNGEETAPTLVSSDGWLTLQNKNTNDDGKFAYELSVTGDRSKGDTAFITLDGQTMPFAIVFEENSGGEGGNQQNSALGEVERSDATLIVKSVNNVGDIIELPIDWRNDWGGNIQNIGLTSGVLNDLKSFNKDVFVACRWGVRLTLPKEVIADMASKVTGDNKLWIVTDYRGGEGDENTPDKAVAFRTKLYTGVTPANLTAYTLPTGQNYTFGMDFEEGNSDYVLYCPNENNTDLVKQNNVTVTKKDYDDSDMTCVSFSVDCDGDFVLAPSDYTIQREWPWYGSEGSKFDGMKAALEESNTAARSYVDQYLVDSTGHVKFGDNDTTGISLKDGKDYTAAEVAAIKAAVKAFRAAEWQVHDALGNVQGVQIENDWTDRFGRYLAELANRVGISLWGDYPCWNGVDMTLSNGKTISFYTDCAYGVPAYNESLGVEADSANKTYTIPYTQPEYCFTIPAGSGEVKSLTVKGATSTELKNDEEEVIGYSCQPFQNSNIKVETRCDGRFDDNSNKTYLFSVQVSYDREEYDLPLVITYSDNSTAEFNVKAVDPNPWNPDDTVKANNATGALGGLYKNGFKAPAYGTNFHLRFPDQLHGYDAAKAADYAAGTDHWDYKWSYDTNTGIVTVEVNADHEECWKNCVGTDDVITDGVYFDYWIGGSGESKPAAYGIHLDFNPGGETPDYLHDILTGDYEHSNGWKMAVVNQRSTTSTVLTFKEGTVSYGEVVAMSNDEANNEKPVSNAEYKYALQFNVVTNATKAIKLDTEETQNVPKDRVTAFATVNGVPISDWMCEVPEDGTAFVLYTGDDYTTASTVTQAYGNLVFTNLVGTLGFKVPNGYTTLNYVIDDHSGNYINSGNNGVNPLSVTAGNEVRFPVFKARYNSIKLIWSNDVTGKTLTESLLVEMGNATPWMGLLGDNPASAVPAGTIMNEQTGAFLQGNGVHVTYDPDLGYFSTSVDASDLTDLSALNYTVELTPMEGAAFFKMYGFGGSESPFVHGEERKTQVEAWLAGENPIPLAEVDVNDVAVLPLIQFDTLTVNGLTVYFSATQLFSGVAIQWLDENENVLGYSYVYGRNGDFVTSVPTETKPKVREEVGAPTLEWGGDTDPGFTCDRNPQTGGNGSKVFFQFGMKNQDDMPTGGWTIYLPYEYFGMTKEDGLRRAARGEKPVIYHYLDESCANPPETIHGEYTEYGVMFKTTSFSPFVVDCSAAADATSGTHRYYTTAAKADSPETFDGGIALYGALAVTSLTGMAYVGKKRED